MKQVKLNTADAEHLIAEFFIEFSIAAVVFLLFCSVWCSVLALVSVLLVCSSCLVAAVLSVLVLVLNSSQLSLHLPHLPCVALPCLVLHLHLAFPRLSLHLHLTLPRLTLHLASPRPPPFTLASPSSFALHPLLLSSSSFAHGRCAYAAYLVVLAPLVVTTPASSTNTHCACLASPLSAESHGAYAAQLIASPLPTLIVLASPTHPCRSCPAPSLLAKSRGPASCYMPLDPGEENRACQESCIFDASLVILAAEILCSCIWQPLLESTKEKLSKFCHVPLTGLSKKPVTLSWEDNNCSTMEISGHEIGWGQVMDESSCLD
ncbi:hypothetical protein Fmac_020240 [Flemingia macrophylla]|uniref:Uncharacterized protein n=1 Tax=Flemingia macrophylla TaxID=520843 RepID=A0ABD1LTJ3_9FABA